MRRVVLATTNRGKVAELRRILDGLDIDLVDAREAGLAEVDETAATFTGNARLKARAAVAATGLPAVADDSGLVVDALGGEPGVRSARYAGPGHDDAANVALLLDRLAGVADRGARFVCAAVLAAPGGREWTATGTLEGVIATAPRGTGGFGYDPVFVPEGGDRTAAELAPEEKDAVSHRGRALRALRPVFIHL